MYCGALQLGGVLVEVHRFVSPSGEPRCWRKVPYGQSWLFGRLDDISSDGRGTFGSIDDRYRMTSHLENKKVLASSERMLEGNARAPVNEGDNYELESVWKWKAEGSVHRKR